MGAVSSGDRANGRILVTGSTGFIGRTVTEGLRGAGHRLTLVVRPNSLLPASWREASGMAIVTVPDLADANLRDAFDGVSTVIHMSGLAGLSGRGRNDAAALFDRENAHVTEHLVAAAAAAGVQRFVHLSSIMAITPNVAAVRIDDETFPVPHGPYGRSKLAAEQHVTRLADRGGTLAVSLRPPLVIGPEAKGNWRALQKLAATGWPLPLASLTARRSFISVDTLAEAIVTLCEVTVTPEMSGNYCIADPGPLALPEVVTELRRGMDRRRRLFGFPAAGFAVLGGLTGRQQLVGSLTRPLEVDASRFFTRFGFTPSVPLREAIRQSGAAFLAARTAK